MQEDEHQLTQRQFPEQLYGDQIHLKQVLVNLTKSALTLTERGFVTIFASYNYALEMLKIRVVDSVTGIIRREGEKSSLHTIFRQVAGLNDADDDDGGNNEASGPNSELSIGLKICR